MNEIKNKIKLVIWDLDETFWSGTLSEEGVNYILRNHELIIELSKRGIVNSICSKNDFKQVKEFLTDKGLWDYFVFPEVSWNPKGKAVKCIIQDMNLRADNVLFIDDNLGNINEVIFENSNISACEPSIIESILEHEYCKGKDDRNLSRLRQYKILEEKREIRNNKNLSNHDFLKDSNIKVTLSKLDASNIDRVVELIERTNQLNYTKLRSSKSELLALLNDNDVVSGIVNVSDKYGEYGISGFYLVRSGMLKHFLFSCRTMNMGVENWVYNYLNQPRLVISGSVATQLSQDIDVSYINSQSSKKHINKKHLSSRYLLMGGCDLDQVVHYLHSEAIDTEFNTVNKKGISVHTEHTELLLQKFTDDDFLYLQSLDIYQGYTGDYKLFKTDWDVLIYSPLNDFSRGLYQHKKSGVIIPFDAFNIDWTNKENHKVVPKHLDSLSTKFFEDFSRDFEFIGEISPDKFYKNLLSLSEMFNDRVIYILTGSEVKLSNVKSWEFNMEARHKLLNEQLENLSLEVDNVNLIDVREFITELDHADNIRHYKKHVYARISEEIVALESSNIRSNLKKEISGVANIKKYKSKILNKIRTILD